MSYLKTETQLRQELSEAWGMIDSARTHAAGELDRIRAARLEEIEACAALVEASILGPSATINRALANGIRQTRKRALGVEP